MAPLRIALVLAAALGARAASLDCSPGPVSRGTVALRCTGGAEVRLQAVTPDILRVRIAPDGKFAESLTVRWGFVRDDFPPIPIRTRKAGNTLTIQTEKLRVQATLRPFALKVLDRSGAVLFEQNGTSVTMAPDEHFYGLGFQRKALDLRGQKLQWWRAFRSSEATVPFFMSSRGYGYYSNNTYRHVFDFTGSSAYTITADGGPPDYYVFYGPGYKRILELYTALTGRPQLAHRWALGVGYQSRYFEDQPGVLKNAAGFRREDIPLDWMGLEPGWEEVPYSMKWKWSPKRFPDPEGMIRKLADMGIKLCLWESGDAPKTGYTDEQTRRQWYAPRIEAAIRKGVRFFKQDDPYPRMISSQEMLPPELNRNLGGSGVFSAAEMNNLTNSLYSRTVMDEYRRITGERAMVMFNGYNSSIASHRWPFTWEADFPLGVGALSASLSGHSLVSTRDENESPAGIHLGYLAPFCYLESWAYYKEPWLYSEKLLEMNRFYAKLRYRLLPYLYSSARQSVETGVPLMRPMVLEFPDDPQTHNLSTQYMLGDSLLVGSANAKVYLPKGRWYDFWTGAPVTTPVQWPPEAGGPLYVRGGAIIPMGPDVAYADQKPLEEVRLEVYPAGESSYTLYEDDGRTYDYEKEAFAKTEIRCSEKNGAVTVTVGERKGTYPGMPKRRNYLVNIHTQESAPPPVKPAVRRIPTGVPGAIHLQASPPERVKLNSDGAWLPLKVTIYATIKYAGVTDKSATTRLHLHVNGGAGKVPEDREVNAIEGIATFSDIVFEKPPNYTVQVTGPNLQPATIKIY